MKDFTNAHDHVLKENEDKLLINNVFVHDEQIEQAVKIKVNDGSFDGRRVVIDNKEEVIFLMKVIGKGNAQLVVINHSLRVCVHVDTPNDFDEVSHFATVVGENRHRNIADELGSEVDVRVHFITNDVDEVVLDDDVADIKNN